MKTTLLTLCCTSFLLAPGAHAADKHGHDHGPRHGGVVQEVGDIACELVVKADSVTLHVLEHDKPIATAGAKAEVTLHGGGGKTSVALVPAGENRLTAKGEFRTGVGARATAIVSLPGKADAKFNFRLK
ncbi:MAG: hypothetical protein HZB40_09950 [Rhodocyclales bacterium]|nr:hypothetical protein [Rhodocyclales bacterium]